MHARAALRESAGVQVFVIPSGVLRTNAYLLVDADRGEAVLVDAPEGILAKVQPLLAKHGCRLTDLWLTHGHWDHMQEAARVQRETGARVSAHPADRDLLERPEGMRPFVFGEGPLEPVHPERWVAAGDRLDALGLVFEVRHVPGHCPGNVLFHCAAAKLALVGDALFNGGVGRWDLPGGSFSVLERSIREQIYTLPDDTVVLPGHGEATQVGAEKETNPYVMAVIS